MGCTNAGARLMDADQPWAGGTGPRARRRTLLLGPVVGSLPPGLSFMVTRDGDPVAATSTPFELTGDLRAILASAASTLASCGASLSAGDLVITGSVVPPIDVSDGRTWKVWAPGLGEIGVELTAAE